MIARGVVEGSFEPATIYRDDVKSVAPVLDELILVAPGADVAALTRAAERGVVMGEGANLARHLDNRAANDVTPEVLAGEARAIAERHGLSIDVIGPERAAELGMGMFLAVGRGSDNPPRLIVLRSGEAGAKDAAGRRLALVGKGVCFDSGGISIKPADRMEEMKMDKTGACTVIAAMATVARLSPGTPLMALAPAVENMPGPHSARPGDVVKAMNGKTVDIINTDAEGRLILGDAMCYAEKLGATHLVDIATLTGAVARALGDQITGAFGTPQEWYEAVAAAGAKAGERYWQLPMIDEYRSGPGQRLREHDQHRIARRRPGEERPVPSGVRNRRRGSTWTSPALRTTARRPPTRRPGPRAWPTRHWSSWLLPARQRHRAARWQGLDRSGRAGRTRW